MGDTQHQSTVTTKRTREIDEFDEKQHVKKLKKAEPFTSPNCMSAFKHYCPKKTEPAAQRPPCNCSVGYKRYHCGRRDCPCPVRYCNHRRYPGGLPCSSSTFPCINVGVWDPETGEISREAD